MADLMSDAILDTSQIKGHEMRITRKVVLSIFGCGLASALSAQGFFNLDFESANIAGYSPGNNVPTNAAIPGWTAYYFQTGRGGGPASEVAYDALSLGGSVISVNDTNTYAGFVPLQGRFSVLLFGGSFQVSSMIGQRGLVPNGTQSLQMEISTDGYLLPLGQFIVTLNGQAISMVPLATFPTYTLYGGDVSSFGNQLAALEITAPGVTSGVLGNPILLDDIVFSSQPIPEPGTVCLLVLGTLILGFRRTRGRQRDSRMTSRSLPAQ